MNNQQRKSMWRVLALIFVLGLTTVLFLFRERLSNLEGYGYPGIFLISLLANATLILPVPGVLLTSAMGAVFNPFWVALAAGSGAAFGELSGYLAGYSGQTVIENREWYYRFESWMEKFGDITIFFLAVIPNPLFDIAGIVAGALKMPWYRFLFWSWLGKVIKMFAFAYWGGALLNMIPFAF